MAYRLKIDKVRIIGGKTYYFDTCNLKTYLLEVDNQLTCLSRMKANFAFFCIIGEHFLIFICGLVYSVKTLKCFH